MKIIDKYLSPKEYIPEESKKLQIVLHHTVSSGTADSVRDWFEKQEGRIAVAYTIDKLGNVLCLFNPKHWAYHIGKGSTSQHNRQSIGIEIINEGILTRESVGKDVQYNWTFGKFYGKVYKHSKLWRGSYFFAEYNEAQIIATAELCRQLCKDFNIPMNVMQTMEYDKSNFSYKGIVSHHNLRPDKSDVSPAFDFHKFVEVLNGNNG